MSVAETQVEIPVVIEIGDEDASGEHACRHLRAGHVALLSRKAAIAGVEQDGYRAVLIEHREIDLGVLVEIAGGQKNRVTVQVVAGLLRDGSEVAIAASAEWREAKRLRGGHQVRVAIPVKVRRDNRSGSGVRQRSR